MKALDRAIVRHEIEGLRRYTQSDQRLTRRYAFRLEWRHGVACFSRALRFPLSGFGLQAVGFGVLCEATNGALDSIVRYYDGLGLPAWLLLAEDLVGAEVVPVIRRHGFRRVHGHDMVTTILRTARAPRSPTVAGLTLERVARDRIESFVDLARQAFADRGFVRTYFRAAQVGLMRQHPRSAIGIEARIDGVPAGTGMLYRHGGLASLGGAAVLLRFRGRGIHHAVIAERVRLGVAGGERIFLCRYDETNQVSAQDQRDLGFRPYYRATRWQRE
ncbi:MAG: hypothetical protein AUH85_04205 [Chloroflexi bacterium 13_1_40CM_4_68_4]|nr:MAG: hypothetical protein AUH85_04205 [Chloroflexi bacterium 13_1_40CM_4_68_4]